MCQFCDDSVFVFSNKQRVQLNKDLNIDDIIIKAINQIYDDRKINEQTKKILIQSHYEPLKQAVKEGYNVKVEYGTPNYEFLKQLQINTAVFAAFKNHASIKEMASLLKDKEGNLRSRENFKQEALKIDSKYRGSKLDAEYDTAVRSARMAAQWQKIQKNKRIYPNLRYMLTKSSKPDATHLTYVGIVRPVDDEFWDVHYPPNRWRCQCGVEQTDEDETDIPDNLPPINAEFSFNSGKLGQVFDLDNSEYIKSVPPKEQPKLIKQAKSLVNKEAAINIPYQTLYESKNGNKVEIHPLSFQFNNDVDAVRKVAKSLANFKDGAAAIQILPTVHDKDLRKALIPDALPGKAPDLRLDGTLFDVKEPTGEKPGSRTIKNLMSDALQQAGNAVIVIPEKYKVNRYQLYKMIGYKYRSKDYVAFKLFLNYKGEWSYYTQSSWLDFYNKIMKKPR